MFAGLQNGQCTECGQFTPSRYLDLDCQGITCLGCKRDEGVQIYRYTYRDCIRQQDLRKMLPGVSRDSTNLVRSYKSNGYRVCLLRPWKQENSNLLKQCCHDGCTVCIAPHFEYCSVECFVSHAGAEDSLSCSESDDSCTFGYTYHRRKGIPLCSPCI